MKNFIYNIGYFLKETKTILQLNALSNIFSLLSTGLIFFILAMVMSGWWVSSQVVEAIQEEAEISVYYEESMDNYEVMQLMERLKIVNGVREVRLIDESEAYQRMEEILGKEAGVLAYLEDNPFNSFIEVSIHMEEMDFVLGKINLMTGVDYIRDNREVLSRIENISGILKLLGYLIITAVGISTLVIIGHIIRLGIYNNREQINTLRLLGAHELFIAFPFLLVGMILTLGGGLLASAIAATAIKYIYAQMAGPLPFIPLPPQETLVSGIVMIVILLSAILGIVGSGFGLSSAKRD
ncbi:MAG TPA: permease-like cell division protein FtsX [Patescibacteria group bacterium]|nr:permease-like cell division protein FtsX [Patescibacteria group bacterium]